jgi:hypothetical protein
MDMEDAVMLPDGPKKLRITKKKIKVFVLFVEDAVMLPDGPKKLTIRSNFKGFRNGRRGRSDAGRAQKAGRAQ